MFAVSIITCIYFTGNIEDGLPVTVGRIIEITSATDGDGNGQKELIKHGAALFRHYSVILDMPELHPTSEKNIYLILIRIDTDRSQFRKHALNALVKKDGDIRYSALVLLAIIGDKSDEGPITVLATDTEIHVRYQAIRTLSEIGTENTLISFEILKRINADSKDNKILPHIKKCKESLELRLSHPKKR